MTTLRDVRQAQPEWFSRSNKKFFNDLTYKILHGKKSKRPLLVRSTYMWSDMFGRERRISWRINPLQEDLTIAPLVDTVFRDYEDVKDWLSDN